MKKILVPGLILTFLLAFSVNALIIAEFEPVDFEIFPDETAIYNIKLTNYDMFNHQIGIYTNDPNWILNTEPTITSLESEETIETTLKIRPKSSVTYTFHGFDINIKSYTTDDIVKETVFVGVLNPATPPPGVYVPSIRINAELSNNGVINPTEKFMITLNIENLNMLEIENMDLIVESKLINQQENINIGSLEYKTVIFSQDFNKYTPPQEDFLKISAIIKNKTITTIHKLPFQIGAYSPFFTRDKKSDKGFLITTESVTFTNDGNVKREESVKVITNTFNKFFTITEPISQVSEDEEGIYFTWTLNIEPQESVTITITKDYRGFFLSIIIIILLTLSYFFLRSQILINKEVVKIGRREEGSISELKVLIHIRNRSNKTLNNIHITDYITSLLELIPESSLGSIAPSKVLRHDKKGTILKWDLIKLEPFEERVITYRIKSKLSIIGGLTLPFCSVNFSPKEGKQRTVTSNTLNIGS